MKNPKGKFYTVRYTYFETGEVKIKEYYRTNIKRTIAAQIKRDGYSLKDVGNIVSVTIEKEMSVLSELQMRLRFINERIYGSRYAYHNRAFDCERIQYCMELLGVYHLDDVKGLDYDYNNQ